LFFYYTKTEAIPATLALSMLQAGNKRFVENRSILLNNSQLRVNQSQEDQDPFAVVFGCSDSRPTPTTIFNRGSSDIFEARTAGEIIYNNFDKTQNSAQVVESIQFGVNVLKVRLLLIMGFLQLI
jgi:carbonic anhydrase